MERRLFAGVTTLIGTIIGAGIFGMPYVIAKAGFLIGAALIVLLGLVVLAINLMLGEVSLRTSSFHQIPGYARKYLGKNGGRIALLSMTLSIYGALIAYIIGEGQALAAIFNYSNPVYFSIAFFAIASFIVYLGLRPVINSETLMVSIMLFFITAICVLLVPHVNLANVSYISWKNMLLPYGVILFALSGEASIPEIRMSLARNKNLFKKILLIGTIIPIIVYILFAFLAVAATGANTTEIATIGLGQLVGEKMILFGNFFAIFAMATSFIILGLALRDMYIRDYKLKTATATAITCLPAAAVALSGYTSFVETITISGAFFLGITGILTVFIWQNAKRKGDRKPEYSFNCNWAKYVIIAVYIGGMIYTAGNLLGII